MDTIIESISALEILDSEEKFKVQVKLDLQ